MGQAGDRDADKIRGSFSGLPPGLCAGGVGALASAGSFHRGFKFVSENVSVAGCNQKRAGLALAIDHQHAMVGPEGVSPNFGFAFQAF